MTRASRKPLVLRGARQVGKTFLIENWGRAQFNSVLKVDLERERDLHSLFSRTDPKQLLEELITVNDGALAEQFVGQELLCAAASFEDPQLCYW